MDNGLLFGSATPAPGLEVLVTPQYPANFGRFGRFVTSEKHFPNPEPDPFFIDWLSLEQVHQGADLPLVHAGVVWATDEDGAVRWRVTQAQKVEGSHETSVQVYCDGTKVRFSGNVSRFGRRDNLWGFDLPECVRRINAILGSLGLPPFTPGEPYHRHVRNAETGRVTIKSAWTGATIQRIDLTANYETGSLSNARAYMEWLGTQQQTARIKVGTLSDGETIDWGRGSRAIYSKTYLKSAELKKHGGPQRLIQHCEQVGLIRFEITLKSTWLHNNGCHYLGGIDMETIRKIFKDRQSVMTRAESEVDDLEHLQSRALRCTARDWLAGDDMAAKMSERTFRRHRKELLRYGIDIAVKRNVVQFKPRVRVIEVRPAAVPAWYR